MRSALLALVCLAVVAVDAGATTLCIDRDGTAAIEPVRDGRCDGCDETRLPLAPSELPAGAELQSRRCNGCLDVDIAGIEQAARRDLELPSVSSSAIGPAPRAAIPLPPVSPARIERMLHPPDARAALPLRASVLRC